jgi:N-glycosylase/DNA lyase
VRKADYFTAKSLLMELPGVGAKVADCICLMSLGHHGAVPVDTHVFSVTVDHYLPKLRGMKSVTPRVYNEIGDFYRARFGPMAGWAHSILFTADLTRFKEKTAGSSKRRRKS